MADNKVIVYAEDDRALRLTGKQVLGSLGYEVRPHENGQQALDDIRMLAAEGKQPLLLTDNDMPVMTGMQLIEQLAREGIRVPTVMLSAHDKIAEEIETAGLADKVDVLLAKPLDVRTLKEALPTACTKCERLQQTSHRDFASRQDDGTIRRA